VAAVAGAFMTCSPVVGASVVVGGLVACWAASYAFAHLTIGAQYWFFFPIMLAAARFRWRGALLTAVAAGFLAGPLLPSVVPLTEGQRLQLWIGRGLFFVVMGQVLAAILAVTLSQVAREQLALREAKALALALNRGEFVVWYQPIVDLKTRAVVGAEALVRWNHPTKGLIAPGDFIERAEQSGTIVPLGAHVLDTACRQLELWRESVLVGRDSFKLAVNISALQLSTQDMVGHLQELLGETSVPADWLNLEITETAAIADLETTASKVAEVREIGVQIAIDDFGTGHNSLAHLHRLPVDVVKIDRSFVADPDRGPGSFDMAAAVIALARALGMRTVAEGVETPAQAAKLAELGADFAQGYLYGRPQPASALTELLLSGAPEDLRRQITLPLP
jgi:EAL domain-containing protein (putative c-di-GMP-specific phosphodiesterase class I)